MKNNLGMLERILERPSVENSSASASDTSRTASLASDLKPEERPKPQVNGSSQTRYLRSAFLDVRLQESPTNSGDSSRSRNESHVPIMRVGAAATQGTRQAMEDAHVAVLDLRSHPGFPSSADTLARAFFGVFDGHSGENAARFAEQHLLPNLLSQETFLTAPAEALVDAFKRTDADFYGAVHREEDPERDAGTTALAALVAGDSLLVANAGDCRAVICRRGRAVDLSRDHNAEYEAARVEAAGGYFLDEFLCGQLGVTRALGNFTPDIIALKQPSDRLKYRTSSDGQPLTFGGPLIAEPEVQTYTLTSEDEFLVLACDGLWDVMSSQRCMELARSHLRDNNDPQLCAEYLVQASLDMSSVDNVTAMVICFSKDPPPSRQMGRSASRGPSRSLSRECLSTLSSAILDAQCQPAGLERQNQW
ncbi:hypothetical protein CVIRNUC_007008 [Coccomyxa viridis]|uniref:PPM-type phosphatase domain-containing protein n=1 Tax=Coccomyxa viridis TaxID=1274662 RepID=A0AAV1ID47_9CHLO|nr:hypothetical protein CVIRNUC_007008 [Coccomyxa viridis]